MGNLSCISRRPGGWIPGEMDISFDAVGAHTRTSSGTMKVDVRSGMPFDPGWAYAVAPRSGFPGRLSAGSRKIRFRGR